MKALRIINLGILVVIGCVAGAVKLVPGNMDLFLQQAGFSSPMILAMGVVQLASGLFLLHPKTRLWAAIALAATLVASTVSIFIADRADLAWYSMIPIIMAGFAIRQAMPHRSPAAAGQ